MRQRNSNLQRMRERGEARRTRANAHACHKEPGRARGEQGVLADAAEASGGEARRTALGAPLTDGVGDAGASEPVEARSARSARTLHFAPVQV